MYLQPNRWAFICTGIISLAVIYIFQRFDYLGFLLAVTGSSIVPGPYWFFVVNKTIRLILNDGACFLLIYGIFKGAGYLKAATAVFLFELIILLPLYFSLKLILEGDSEISSPLLSQLHRLIINPTLMILLMAGYCYQRFKAR